MDSESGAVGERSRVDVRALLVLDSVYLHRDSVGAYVQRSAGVRGAPVSVRANDVVCVRDEAVEAHRAEIVVHTQLSQGFEVQLAPGAEGFVGTRDASQVWVTEGERLVSHS